MSDAPGPAPAISVRVLGPVRIEVGGALLPIAANRQRVLLARLALAGPGGVRRGDLITDLWGDGPPKSAVNAVQVVVSSLRRTLGTAAIETDGTTYALAPAVAVDSRAFEHELADAERAVEVGDDVVASALLTRALGRWSADALLDVDAPFAEAWRDRLGDRRLAAIELEGACLVRTGRATAAVDLLSSALADVPYRERLAAGLMLTLDAAARQKDALDLFERVRRRLADDLGLDPGPELIDARMRVLRGHRVPQAAPPSRLRTGLRALPAPILGREAELERLRSMLEGADVRLVTLLGAGGIGKTRLAEELVRLAPASAALVPLAGATAADELLPRIAHTLGVGAPGAIDVARLADAIRAHTGPLLLVLDGFEHVRSGASAVAELLAAAPGLRIVATSRSPLRLPAEHRIEIGPLAVGSPDSPAVRMLVDRIRAQHPLALDRGQEGRLAAIAELCAGMPLALELAAARTGVLGLVELHDRLRESMRVLDGDGRTDSLSASVRSSVDGLSPSARQLLGAASVFRDGFDKADLAAVVGVPLAAAEASLGELLDRSLVRVEPLAGPLRFAILDPVRDLVHAGLAPDRRERFVVAHMRRFAWVWCRHDYTEHHPSSAEQLRAIAVEAANLQAAVETARRTAPGEFGWMAARLGRAWDLLGRSAVRDGWAAELLVDADLPPRLRFDLLVDRPWPSDEALAEAATTLDAFDDPRRRHALTALRFGRAVLRRRRDDAEALRRRLDDATGVAPGAQETVLAQADAMLALLDGDHTRSRELLDEARRSALARGSELVALAILRGIGEVLLLAGDHGGAVAAALDVVAGTSAEQRSLRAAALSTLGAGLLLQGDAPAARRVLDDAIGLIPAVGWDADVDDALLRWAAARAAVLPLDTAAHRVHRIWVGTREALALPPWDVEAELAERHLTAPDGPDEVASLIRRGGPAAATGLALDVARSTIGDPGPSRLR